MTIYYRIIKVIIYLTPINKKVKRPEWKLGKEVKEKVFRKFYLP